MKDKWVGERDQRERERIKGVEKECIRCREQKRYRDSVWTRESIKRHVKRTTE